MLGRRRSGTKVADAHHIVKTSLRQQESQTPTQWCGKATRPCPQTNKGFSSWGRLWGMHTSLPENCRPRHRSTQFCCAGFLQDLQCAWLLLLFCAATRANYFLRVVQPAWSERFAAAHNENVWNCTQELLDIEGTARVRQLSSLLLVLGGSFVPRLPRIGPAGQIHSHEFEKGIPALQTLSGSPCSGADSQRAAIFRLQQPAGNDFQMSDLMPQSGETLPEDRDQADSQRTGPHRTTFQVAMFGQRGRREDISPGFRLARAFTGGPSLCQAPMWSICWHPVHCRCGRPLDVRGHHRSACARRGFPLESAVSQRPRGWSRSPSAREGLR